MSYQATDGGGGGVSKGLNGLGSAIGLIASILGTPVIFNATKTPLYVYLAKGWGRDLADFLVWIVGAAEAYAIYKAVALIFTIMVTWAMATHAAKRFGG